MTRLFDPVSVAVVGASAAFDKPGYQMVKALAAFDGEVYPVNPRAETILGRRVYPALADIPGTVDLVAVIDVWPTLPEAVKAGIVAMVKAVKR